MSVQAFNRSVTRVYNTVPVENRNGVSLNEFISVCKMRYIEGVHSAPAQQNALKCHTYMGSKEQKVLIKKYSSVLNPDEALKKMNVSIASKVGRSVAEKLLKIE
jgi:hypothetical protein